MKIGIMGGTFDPIHIGHLLLAEFAYEDFGLDEIWFLPNGNPYYKNVSDAQDALRHRVEMVRISIEGAAQFHLSLKEAHVDETYYTYQTMGTFRKEYPQHEFYFILGADSLFSIEEWKYFKEIFPTCTILAAMRDDKDVNDMQSQIRYLSEAYGAQIELLRAPLLEISSTTIRERAARKKSIRYMVPDQVARYIRENHLYQEDCSLQE